jgi:hypothetical protein
MTSGPATRAELELIHDPVYIDLVRLAAAGRLGPRANRT